MKKLFILFSICLAAALVFASCSMFESGAEKHDSDKTASVSFSIPPQLLRSISEKAASQIYADETHGRNGDEREMIISCNMDVKLTGTYSDSRNVYLGEFNLESQINPDTFKIEDVKFDSVPIGSTIKAEVFFYSAISINNPNGQSSYKRLQYKGASETITVKKGNNGLSVQLIEAFKAFPVSITLDFKDSERPSDISNFQQIVVMAFTPDSSGLQEFYKRFGGNKGTKEDYEYLLDNIYGSTNSAGGSTWYYPDFYSSDPEVTRRSLIDENKIILTAADVDLMQEENLVFVAFAIYGGLNNIYLATAGGNSLESLKASAIRPSDSGTEISLHLSKLPNQPIYSAYTSGALYNQYYAHLTTNLDEITQVEYELKTSSIKTAYDSKGNWYGLKSVNNDTVKIVSNIFGSDEVTLTLSQDANYSYGITIDTVSDTFYFYDINEATLNLHQFPSLISSGNTTEQNYYTISPNVNNNEFIVINNSVCYDFVDTSSGENLIKFPVQGSVDDVVLLKENLFSDEVQNIQYSDVDIKDMMYIDGYIYAIGKTKAYENWGTRGVLVKCNASNGECSFYGYAPDKKITEYKAAQRNGDGYKLYTAPEKNALYIEEYTSAPDDYNWEITFRSPFNNEDSYFVGPERFVAVKPKKLVISDAGYAFYTNKEGVLAMRKVNRVIELDLENLSMENPNTYKKEIPSYCVPNESYPSGTFSISSASMLMNKTNYYRLASGDEFVQLTDLADSNRSPYIIDETPVN